MFFPTKYRTGIKKKKKKKKKTPFVSLFVISLLYLVMYSCRKATRVRRHTGKSTQLQVGHKIKLTYIRVLRQVLRHLYDDR